MTIYDEILEFVRQHGKRKPFANPYNTEESYVMPAGYRVVIDSASAMPEDAVVSISQDGKMVYPSFEASNPPHFNDPYRQRRSAWLKQSGPSMKMYQLKRALGIWKFWERQGYLEDWKEEAV